MYSACIMFLMLVGVESRIYYKQNYDIKFTDECNCNCATASVSSLRSIPMSVSSCSFEHVVAVTADCHTVAREIYGYDLTYRRAKEIYGSDFPYREVIYTSDGPYREYNGWCSISNSAELVGVLGSNADFTNVQICMCKVECDGYLKKINGQWQCETCNGVIMAGVSEDVCVTKDDLKEKYNEVQCSRL